MSAAHTSADLEQVALAFDEACAEFGLAASPYGGDPIASRHLLASHLRLPTGRLD